MRTTPRRPISTRRTLLGVAALIGLVAPAGVGPADAAPAPPPVEASGLQAQPAAPESVESPTLSLNAAADLEGDAGTTLLHFTLSLSGSLTGAIEGVARTYGSTDDPYPEPATATSNVDYQHMNRHWFLTEGSPTFDFYVAVIGDTEVEPDEFFYLQIFCEGDWICGFYEPGYILNDDGVSKLSIHDAVVVEDDYVDTTAEFVVTLEPAASTTVTVDYSTCGLGCEPAATATGGDDYEIAIDTLTFAPGETSRTIDVVVYGDLEEESDEIFFVNLFDPVNATLVDASAMGTILDEDGTDIPPVANNDSATVPHGGSLVIDVLANDANPSGYALEIIEVSEPDHGLATIDYLGTITYAHDASPTTSDSFTYKLTTGFADSMPATVSIEITGYVPDDGSVGTLEPARLLETRTGPNNTTIDGKFEGIGQRPAGSTLELTVAGRGGVPTDADAVFLNITAIVPTANGYLTAYPCGTTRPNASNVNYFTGAVTPNAVLAKIGTNGKVCIYTLAATHLITDVNGYVP